MLMKSDTGQMLSAQPTSQYLRPDLPCTYLAHHEPGSVNIVVIVVTITKLASHTVAAEQDQSFGAGESDQHCSGPCCSSVEQGAADAAADAGRHDPGAI